MNGVITMIQVLTGEKGSGKTKKMVSLANDLVSQANGHVVYISNNSEVMFELNSNVRLIDVSQFPITSDEMFSGFLYGIISQDYDIDAIFIDNLNTILKEKAEYIESILNAARDISLEHNINLYFGLRNAAKNMEQPEVEYIAV
jgi:Tfp pilus assembly pilus retraction ATPase PilT